MYGVMKLKNLFLLFFLFNRGSGGILVLERKRHETKHGNYLKLWGVSHIIGPICMNPVNRDGSVSEIWPHHYFLCKRFDVFA